MDERERSAVFVQLRFLARETGREVMNASSSKSPWRGIVQVAAAKKRRHAGDVVDIQYRETANGGRRVG